MRISRGKIFRKIEITMPEATTVNVVASPIESPFTEELVTASVGHIPRSWRSTGFSFQIPLKKTAALEATSFGSIS